MRTIVLWTMKDEIGARIFSDYLSIYKISMKLFAFALTLFLIAPGEGVAEPGSNEIYAKFIVILTAFGFANVIQQDRQKIQLMISVKSWVKFIGETLSMSDTSLRI